MAYRDFSHDALLPRPLTFAAPEQRRRYAISAAALAFTALALALLTFALAYFAVGDIALALVTTAIALLPFVAILAQQPGTTRGRSRRSALPVALDVRAYR